jgi:hypothetical protein
MTKQKPAQPTTHEKLSLDGNYPGLNGFKYAIGYLEQALNIASEPLLAACFVIAVIDVMTGGHLMDIELISYTWATALALAVTANFIITWRRSATALRLNRYGTSITLAILGVLLGIVDCAALAIKGLQQMLNIPFTQALTWLYLNPVLMVYIRSIVAVSILVVVALSNHLAITTAQAPKRRLALWEKALNKLAPVVSDETAQPAQSVSTPEASQKVEQGAAIQSARLHIVETNPVQPHLDALPLERVRQVLSSEPHCSDRKLGKSSGMSAATAKKYRLLLEQERSAVNSR